jgi:hypothetical protein
VNAIADAVAKDHPGIIIDTLAYQYTRKPPKRVRPRPNVAIRLCSIECEFNRPLDTSPYNASFVDDIKGWNAICDRLHIWDYVINYAHCVQPFPNLKVLQPNIRFFVANGVTGIYEEANYFSRGGELAELRTYLMAKLLWNPDANVDLAMREFLAAYYGAAAPRIANYIEETHRLAVSDPSFHMPIYVAPKSPFQTPEALKRFGAMFDEAERLVRDDPVRLHRVEVARLPILYTQIAHAGGLGYVLTDDALVPSSAGDLGPALERFERIARAEGLTAVSEGGTGSNLDGWLGQVRGGIAPRPVIRLQGGGLEAVVVPSLGGRILSLRRASDGRELLQVVRDGQEIDPTGGGYEEFSESGYRSPGWSEPYEVVASDARGVTLRATLKNGLRLERRYELDATRSALSVRSEITNTASAPRTACLRVHPAFRLDSGATARIVLGPPGASDVTIPTGAGEGFERWFRGAELPPGTWALVDETGHVAITSVFSPDEVEGCYLNRGGADNRVNLELWSHARELAPGQSLTVSHRYEIGSP